MFSPDKFENGTWWKSITMENEEEITNDLVESFNLHEEHEDDKDQMKQIFIRKIILGLLFKYPNHVMTFSSCSLNKKVLGIRDKIGNLQGLNFENMTGWRFKDQDKFLERFMIVLMTSASMEK